LFMNMLRAPHALFSTLRRMKRYGVLGAYLPAFGAIVGQMQYDLSIFTRSMPIPCWSSRTCGVSAIRKAPNSFLSSRRLRSAAQAGTALPGGAVSRHCQGPRRRSFSELGAVDARAFCLHHGLGKWRSQSGGLADPEAI
jgi:[protein-PII] uridylyltransferase